MIISHPFLLILVKSATYTGQVYWSSLFKDLTSWSTLILTWISTLFSHIQKRTLAKFAGKLCKAIFRRVSQHFAMLLFRAVVRNFTLLFSTLSGRMTVCTRAWTPKKMSSSFAPTAVAKDANMPSRHVHENSNSVGTYNRTCATAKLYDASPIA